MRKKVLITAHSGCDGTADNSMEFIQYALGLDIDCIEVDVRWGQSESLIISHDAFDQGVPLADVFEALIKRRNMKLNCDLKAERLEMPVWALAAAYGVQSQMIYSGSVSAVFAQSHPQIMEELDWFMNAELILPNIYKEDAYERYAGPNLSKTIDKIREALEKNKARCLNINFGVMDTPAYDELMRQGIALSLWTPNDEAVILRLLNDGVYNITTRNTKNAAQLARYGETASS